MLQGLLLTATFLLSSLPANAVKELPEVKKYEVVFPRRLHPLHKREIKQPGQERLLNFVGVLPHHETQSKEESENMIHSMEKFETELKYEMAVNGKIAVLYLKKNKDLLAPGYTETHYNSSGKEVTTSPQIMDNCYYQGHIINETVSDASISTCRGLRGYFSQGDQRYFIEPLSPTAQDEQEHALFKDEPQEQQTNSDCGMDDVLWAHGFHRNMVPPDSSLNSKDWKSWERKKYVEYYLVLDNGEFIKYHQDPEEIRKRVFEMVNYINMLYKKLNTHVALIGMEIWNDKDKIHITSNASSTLENFSQWRGNVLLRRKPHDVAQLITAKGFSGTTVGLAFMSTMCSPYHSVGLIQDHSNNGLRVAGTMAHEMGHNFGMFHDTDNCHCSSAVCVMDRALRFNLPKDFSSCSRDSYAKFFGDKLSNCVLNAPLPTDIISTPTCGNQLIEMGEDCDCGTPEECTNICCDAKTCKSKVNFQCAVGECCEKCQFKKAGAVCRPAKDECDLAEMCDGKSGLCPSDRFQVNGLPCQDGKGYCLNGTCPTLQEQCTEMWGPGTKVADKSCFSWNEGGSKYGYCRKVDDTRIPCKANDVMCGKLFCQGGSEYLPWRGRIVTFLTCKAFEPEVIGEEVGMVANGTKCGNKKVCINAECVDMERVYKSANCSYKCKGHAVCDHELQCQCKEGWAPPNCDDVSAVFNFSIVVGVLFPVAIILVVVAIVIRYKSPRGKQKKVLRPLSAIGIGPHRQKRKLQTEKAVQPQEMKFHAPGLPVGGSELPASLTTEFNSSTRITGPGKLLITKPDFPPPPIPTSVSSSFLHKDTKGLSPTVFQDKLMSTPKVSNPKV